MASLQNDIDDAVSLVLFNHLTEHFQALIVRRNTGAADGEVFISQRVVDIAGFRHALFGGLCAGAVFITHDPTTVFFNGTNDFLCRAANGAAGYQDART